MSADAAACASSSVYAPNGRQIDSPFYEAELAWYDKLARWINPTISPNTPAVIGGDFNVAPDDIDVWDPRACDGGTHVSEEQRQAFARLSSAGFFDAYQLHRRNQDGTHGGTTAPAIFIKLRRAHRSPPCDGAIKKPRDLGRDRS